MFLAGAQFAEIVSELAILRMEVVERVAVGADERKVDGIVVTAVPITVVQLQHCGFSIPAAYLASAHRPTKIFLRLHTREVRPSHQSKRMTPTARARTCAHPSSFRLECYAACDARSLSQPQSLSYALPRAIAFTRQPLSVEHYPADRTPAVFTELPAPSIARTGASTGAEADAYCKCAKLASASFALTGRNRSFKQPCACAATRRLVGVATIIDRNAAQNAVMGCVH